MQTFRTSRAVKRLNSLPVCIRDDSAMQSRRFNLFNSQACGKLSASFLHSFLDLQWPGNYFAMNDALLSLICRLALAALFDRRGTQRSSPHISTGLYTPPFWAFNSKNEVIYRLIYSTKISNHDKNSIFIYEILSFQYILANKQPLVLCAPRNPSF